MVTNALYDATVAHVRRIDPPHAFAHRVYLWRVDLDDLPRLPWWLRPFARFDRRDHFAASDPRGIREKLDAWLAERGVDLGGGRVVMLAAARVLGYAFNPISVYWCHEPDGGLACVIAEVHNTYGGRHAYLLHPDEAGRARTAKEFYVSPFQEMDGEYRMRLPHPEALLDLTVALRRGTATPLVATLRGVRRPVNPRWLARLVLARPLLPQRVSALIRRHGVTLWLRKAAVVPRTPQNAGGQLHG
ncbi:DUF1365 domain-containing protein [Amycolatopsis sp. NPDC026612]|uniref:DUF1365 domain-containing protein n=1 Tax=Amycolatopsis sp. NPDC026612 TaxID=3155466 RepID=UPI0033C261C2